MSTLEVFFISLSLSIDNMAVATASGCSGKKHGILQIAKVAAAFALTGIICFIAGWFGGRNLETFIKDWDHWVAFALLGYIGFKMARQAFSKEEDKCYDITKPSTLFTMALATNIDVLAVGVSLALYNVSLPLVLSILTLCIISATALGFTLGRKLSGKLGKKMELAGGLVLIVLSFKILIEGLIH